MAEVALDTPRIELRSLASRAIVAAACQAEMAETAHLRGQYGLAETHLSNIGGLLASISMLRAIEQGSRAGSEVAQ